MKNQQGFFREKFANVHAFADADFDMDIDPNFHESESLFYESLNHIKKEDEASDEEQEQTAQE